MKTLTILIFFLLISATTARSQSVLALGPGTSMGVLAGANLCANIINGSGILYGNGGICGGLVAIEPAPANELPVKFEMLQNYPNPFNPVTTVKYQLPEANFVSIKLYDQLGRETAVLFEGNQQAGYYNITVDGSNLASGIYFCRITVLQNGSSKVDPSNGSGLSFTKVIKMSLIK